jgi:hypothetical protein
MWLFPKPCEVDSRQASKSVGGNGSDPVHLAVGLEKTLLELYPRLVLCWVNNILDVFIPNFLFVSCLLGGAAILDDVVNLSLKDMQYPPFYLSSLRDSSKGQRSSQRMG